MTPRAAVTFRVATLNVLGASHTSRANGAGKVTSKSGARGIGYQARTNYAIQLIAAHQADVVGLQEFESRQAELFDDLVGPVWELWPRAGGTGADGRNSIAFRSSVWELVRGTSLAVPYFNGHTFKTPVALLRHRSSGRQVWFINVHNAADTKKYPRQGRWRDAALEIELRAVAELGADGTPVILMGDMNAREAFYCPAVARGLSVPNPYPTTSGCVLAGSAPIDWIVGTSAITWGGYARDRSPLAKAATDHPVISATAIIR